MKIILASTSPRRLSLLQGLGFEIVSKAPNIDETQLPNEKPVEMVQRLAKLKIEALNIKTDVPIIGADTIVSLDHIVLGKPKDVADAIRMLTLLSGQTHEVITGYAVKKDQHEYIGYVSTFVTFRTLSEREIMHYIEIDKPFDKAGAYAIQTAGASLTNHIKGSYTNIIGLPINEVLIALDKVSNNPAMTG
jgi:septum formation protein